MADKIWYCPICNNGDMELNAHEELEKFRKALSIVAHGSPDLVFHLVCDVCDRHWFFNPSEFRVSFIEPSIKFKEIQGHD